MISKPNRLLSIAPSTNGFGFAVMENGCLIDWGNKRAKEDKNRDTLEKLEKLLGRYLPDAIVLQDVEAKDSQRRPRIRKLVRQIRSLAKNRKIEVALLSRKEVMQAFFDDGNGAKYELAKMIAERFPQELANRLPPPRKPWKSEDKRMDIFDAVAFGLTFALAFKSHRQRSQRNIPLAYQN